MNKNLVLTGMMGVGKTTVGKSLAEKLSFRFIDIDKLIEEKEGLSINLIFKLQMNFEIMSQRIAIWITVKGCVAAIACKSA